MAESSSTEPTDVSRDAEADRPVLALMLRAAIVGPLAAAGATAFAAGVHELESLLWVHLPDTLGYADPPGWWVVLVLVLGALLTAAALGLPGSGGHRPTDGLAFDIGPGQVVSVLAAGLATLAFGAVLGPEAPALAIGTAVGAVVWAAGPAAPAADRTILMVTGGMAAFGALLGNPLALAVLALEAALLAGTRVARPVTMAPLGVGLAFGYLVQVGLGDWPGLGEVVLAVPGLPAYPDVRMLDLLVSVALAVVVALVVGSALRASTHLMVWGHRRPRLAALLVAALGTAALALLAGAVVDVPVHYVLFSGQAATAEIVAESSISIVAVAVVAKAAAFALCLGSGFRGGIVFPGIFIGLGLAVLTTLLVDEASLTALAAAGVAAAVAATLRMVFTSALLAVLVTASAGLAVTTPALVGAVVGLLVALAMDRRRPPRTVPPPSAPSRGPGAARVPTSAR